MQLGVIGLGRMGGNIVRRLMRAGHECVVYDRDPKPGQALAADGAVLANSGHFSWEIDVDGLRSMTRAETDLDGTLRRFDLANGRHVVLVADGRMFNLAGVAPKGNSIESMDIGFMLQALSLQRVALSAAGLAPGAQPVPDDINRRIARAMLAAMGAAR